MARKNSRLAPSNLAFLDIMSCGLGAVALIFLLLKPGESQPSPQQNHPQLDAEINLLNEDIQRGKENLVAIRNTVSDVSDELAITQGLARQIEDKISRLQDSIAGINPSNEEIIAALKKQLESLQQKHKQLQQDNRLSNKAASFVGDGQRQYLTGLKLNGRRILVLLDSSASMLDNSVINIILRRNSSEYQQRMAPKWQKSLAIVQWIMSNIPLSSDYQILTFNDQIQSIDNRDLDQWHAVSDGLLLQQHLQQLQALLPANGTDLKLAITTAMDMSPRPDNIFIITDGLPTLDGSRKRKGTISGQQRLKLFNSATRFLDPNIPINIMLLPLEGDYLAAGAFWQLAVESNGSFITPTQDWP